MATNTYDCEPYLRALEEQAEAMQKGGEELLGVMEVVKREVDSMITSLGNMKLMVDMTRRAATLAHGGRVVERVEIKKEQEDTDCTVETAEFETTARDDVFASQSITTS